MADGKLNGELGNGIQRTKVMVDSSTMGERVGFNGNQSGTSRGTWHRNWVKSECTAAIESFMLSQTFRDCSRAAQARVPVLNVPPITIFSKLLL